ncbi:hypothetical protein [Actinoplanes sp. NPDC049118]|uniref:hypothetical protein n=1 Tax=Actinoplanes sp. NPDC049118 TaxID=3155769 RepID=UPI0033D27DEF
MPHLVLTNRTDTINLDDVANFGTGAQATAGATGLGFPEVSAQWIEGAGDGATYRGSRLRSRNIDLPLHLVAADRPRLQELVARLEMMLASGECTLRWVQDDGTYWSTSVAWQGGGGWRYGTDTTGERDLSTVITLRAGSPYWTYSVSSSEKIQNSSSGRGLLNGPLTRMRVAASQAIGEIRLTNPGTAPAYPVWTVQGPGTNFVARSPSGATLRWAGTLTADEKLIIDCRTATVTDGTGANRYGQLAPAPKFWPVPPGTSVAVASLENTSTGALTATGPALATNLVTNPNHENTAGLAASVSTGAQITAGLAGTTGAQYARWTTPANSGTASYRVARSTALSRADIVADQTYTLLIRLRQIGGSAGTLPIRIAPATGAPWVMANINTPSIGDAWTKFRHTFTAAVDGSDNSDIGLYITLPNPSPTVDSHLDIDYWAVMPGAYTGDYFDGTTTDSEAGGVYGWTGTANASTSIRRAALVTGRSSITCTWQPRKRVII